MSNTSNILPGTTHVYLDLVTYERDKSNVRQWLIKNAAGRVDAFAYEADDPMDHQSLFAVVNGGILPNIFSPDLSLWIAALEDNGQTPRILFAFENDAAATLFKLTFGGVA